MSKLNNDIIFLISDFFSIKDYLKFKDVTTFTNYKTENIIKEKKKLINNIFIDDIINLFGGINKFVEFPVLEWKNKFVGGTDYIDSILNTDLSSPIMFGKDCYNRSFITIKYFENTGVKTITLFQRYTNIRTCWTHGSRYYQNLIKTQSRFYNGKFQDKHIIDNISNLLNNKKFITYVKYNFGDPEEDIILNNVYLTE